MSISYADTRDSEHLRLLTPPIDAFIARPRPPAATTSSCPRQTVFFFPGGLATRLLRATTKFKDGVTESQTFDYEVLWVTPEGIKNGTPRHLRMHRDDAGVFRDKGDRIIVASSVIYDPLYEDFTAWCASNNLDLGERRQSCRTSTTPRCVTWSLPSSGRSSPGSRSGSSGTS